jgi:hypothetical protein
VGSTLAVDADPDTIKGATIETFILCGKPAFDFIELAGEIGQDSKILWLCAEHWYSLKKEVGEI